MTIEYTCEDCGVSGVRLWREYNTFLNHIRLRCRSCAILNQKGKASNCWTSEPFGDQIGWLVPAVPTVELDTFWGYSSVPQDRVDWWHALPVSLPTCGYCAQPVPEGPYQACRVCHVQVCGDCGVTEHYGCQDVCVRRSDD